MKQKQNRAYNVYVNGKLQKVVGGEKAGRFYSNDVTPAPRRKSARNRNVVPNKGILLLKLIGFLLFTKKGLKFTCWIIAVSWFLSTIQISTKPFNEPKVEQNKVEASEVSITREEGFISREIPRDYVEPDLFDKYFGLKADEARKVAKCESGMRDVTSKPNRNGTYDYGVMQINSLWLKVYNLTPDQLLDRETNISTAKKIYDRTGDFSAWRFSKHCHNL
jgi:hypothetical protein